MQHGHMQAICSMRGGGGGDSVPSSLGTIFYYFLHSHIRVR